MYKSHISILSTHTHSYSSSIRKGSRDCIFACLCCTLRLKRAQTKGNTNIWMWRESSFTSTDTPEANTVLQRLLMQKGQPRSGLVLHLIAVILLTAQDYDKLFLGITCGQVFSWIWGTLQHNRYAIQAHREKVYFLVSCRLDLISTGKAGRALDSLPVGCLHHTVSSILLSIKL